MKCVKKKLDNNKMNKGGKFLKKLWCCICGRVLIHVIESIYKE